MVESTELTVELHSRHRTTIELGAAALVALFFGVLFVQQFARFDAELFARLQLAFGPNAAEAHAGAASETLNAAGYALLGVASTFAIYNIVGPPRYIVCLMLIAVSLAYQWLAYNLTGGPTHPVGFVAAFAAGIGCGAILRTRHTQRRREESTYYELKLKNRELMETRLELLKQDEIERRILAADLHDQVLNDLKQVVQRFEKYTQEPDTENADKIKTLTAQVMREIREVMDSLSPSVLEHLGLAAAVEDCLRRGAERANFRTRFKSRVENEEFDCLSMVEKGLLYRLVQESITNICKHAGASTVRTTLEMDGDELLIKVTDDGKGIDPAMARGDSRGLKYMRYRADLIGATIAWKPGENGKGTTVEIRINLADRRAQTPV